MKPIVMIVFLLVAAGAGAVAWLRQEEEAMLRAEIALLREDQRQLQPLQAENVRLRAAAVPPEELARLQSEHAAVLRLRTELEALRADVAKREVALAGVADSTPSAPRPAGAKMRAPGPPPALTLPLELRADGVMTVDGDPVNVDAIRQRLAALEKGSAIEIQLREPSAQTLSRPQIVEQHLMVQRARETLVRLARELGLELTLTSERPKS